MQLIDRGKKKKKRLGQYIYRDEKMNFLVGDGRRRARLHRLGWEREASYLTPSPGENGTKQEFSRRGRE